ncbi:MAG: nitrite reductase small subunit NirD [Pseudomonadota bacterium]
MLDRAWIAIGNLTDIPSQGGRVVKTPLGCIAVFRTADDEVFALEDNCPHRNGPLSQGIVHGNAVTCPLHNWVISLETGEALGADGGRVATYVLKVEAGTVYLDGARLAKPDAA